MSGQYGAFRFGRESPSRIAGTTMMLAQATDLPPGEPMYQPIPFLPSITTGGTSGTSGTDVDTWINTPTRVDLTFYQGDDVIVPLIITDPSDPTFDMSTTVDWTAEIRVLHTYRSTLVARFSITDAYTPPVGEESGFTEVTLFLPRSENVFIGQYRWDLYSLSPLDAAGFPQPPEVIDPEPWPPTDRIRTWLYGLVTIYPRVTETDFLPTPVVVPDVPVVPVFVSTAFVGPNGRVP